MGYKSWKKCTDPSEIMKLKEESVRNTWDKYDVLLYFALEKEDLVMLDKLLKSGYYSVWDIIHTCTNKYRELDERFRAKPDVCQKLIDFVNLSWQKSNDIDKILKADIIKVSTKNDLLVKLEYFKQHNPEIYEQLLKTKEYQSMRLHDYSIEPAKNKNQIFDILKEHAEMFSVLDLKSYAGIFTEDEFKQLSQAINGSSDTKEYQETILYYLLKNPYKNKNQIFNIFKEHAEMFSVMDLKSYARIFTEIFTEDEFKQLNQAIVGSLDSKEYQEAILCYLFKNPHKNKKQIFNILKEHAGMFSEFDLSNLTEYYADYIEMQGLFNADELAQLKIWKGFESAAIIIKYCMTPENKWEIFEYFANNNEKVFRDIVYGVVHERIENTKKIRQIYRDEIIERYRDVDLNTLPKCLKDCILSLKQDIVDEEELKKQRQEKKDKEKREQLLTWENEDGSIISLFKVGSIEPNSKSDYEKVLKKFLNENIGITTFCLKYKISDVKGFKLMLEKFSAESLPYANQIESKSKQQQAKYIGNIKDIIEKICSEKKSIESIIMYSKAYSFDKLQDFAKNLFPDKNYCDILTIKVIEHYYDRLNSYTNTIDPENISKMLTIDEIRFIVGEEEFTSMMTGKKCEIEKLFLKKVSFLNTKQPELIKQKVIGRRPDVIVNTISQYDTKFKTNEYFRSQTFIRLDNGEQVEVTREMVEMAYQYANSNNLYTSNAIMGYLIRAVANGKIQNQEEVKQDREQMMQQAYELVNEITNIDEYFATIDKLHR